MDDAQRMAKPQDVDWTKTAAVFACSPRAGGNSDTAAGLFARGVTEAGGAAQLIPLRKYDIAPCTGCYKCERESRCHLAARDESGPLFDAMLRAPVLFFSAPIFYYHLPAHFKAFIDRGQSYYLRRDAGDPHILSLPRRTVYAVLVAGRPTGEKLFEGSILTLKYFLKPFNATLAAPMVFRGVDLPGDFAANEQAAEQVLEAGRKAASALREA